MLKVYLADVGAEARAEAATVAAESEIQRIEKGSAGDRATSQRREEPPARDPLCKRILFYVRVVPKEGGFLVNVIRAEGKGLILFGTQHTATEVR